MAKMLLDRGIQPMHPTTIAKIEAGDRAVRINEAVGIADLFEVPLDSLLGRKPGAQRSELAYRLRVFLKTAEQSHQQVTAIVENIQEQLEELPREFNGADNLQEMGYNTGADNLQKMGYNTLRTYLEPASEALSRLVIASDFFLAREQQRSGRLRARR